MKFVVFAIGAAISSLFFIDLCSALFGCGCAPLWAGADVHCNIHLTAMRHCPWCAHGMTAYVIPWALVVAAQAAISFSPHPMNAGLRLVFATLAFPVTGGLLALAYGLASGYWK